MGAYLLTGATKDDMLKMVLSGSGGVVGKMFNGVTYSINRNLFQECLKKVFFYSSLFYL